MKKKLAIVGFRGMVGSVLMQRLDETLDFEKFDITLYSKSLSGKEVSYFSSQFHILDSSDLVDLSKQDIILTCQGSDFTEKTLNPLREIGWSGFWIDAASLLRYNNDSLIVLDPINFDAIDKALDSGVKNFIGGNCTVSLLLLALKGLYEKNMIQWVTSMTYQAVSGAGAKAIESLYEQYDQCSDLNSKDVSTLEKEVAISKLIATNDFPLGYGVIPWIDSNINGQTKEEWKAATEASRIYNKDIAIDGTCVRVSSLRCHSQALTIKLNEDYDLALIEKTLKESSQWIELIENNQKETTQKLSPHYFSGTLKIGVGRVRKMSFDPTMLNIYTIGDQLLWGAAEPLRRALNIIDSKVK